MDCCRCCHCYSCCHCYCYSTATATAPADWDIDPRLKIRFRRVNWATWAVDLALSSGNLYGSSKLTWLAGKSRMHGGFGRQIMYTLGDFLFPCGLTFLASPKLSPGHVLVARLAILLIWLHVMICCAPCRDCNSILGIQLHPLFQVHGPPSGE